MRFDFDCWNFRNKDPYEGKKISRSDLPPLLEIRLDIGGEGLHEFDGKLFGDPKAINLNCSPSKTVGKRTNSGH